jgi:t-SNARE complex subunit (syntaxin)
LGPIPNPQSPIPNPQSPIPINNPYLNILIYIYNKLLIKKNNYNKEMNEGLLNDEKLKQSYLNLKKISDTIKKDHARLIKEDFGEQEWRKEGKRIDMNIKKFEKMLKEVKRNLENAKDNGSANEESIATVEEGLEKIKDTTETQVEQMKDKIGNFDVNFEMENKDEENGNEEDEQQQGQITMNLMNNAEMLNQRKKELQEIHKTSAIIKDTTDIMAQKLNEQGEMLDNVEAHVIKAEDNVEKAGKEINKANELSKSNNKRLCCIMILITAAIGVVLAVVLSLVL